MCLKVIINTLTRKGNFTLYDGNTKMVKMDSVPSVKTRSECSAPERVSSPLQGARKSGVALLCCSPMKEGISWQTLTLSFLPNTTVFPRICSFLNLHSTKFCPFSPGNVMFLRTTVGLAAPANERRRRLHTSALTAQLCYFVLENTNMLT